MRHVDGDNDKTRKMRRKIGKEMRKYSGRDEQEVSSGRMKLPMLCAKKGEWKWLGDSWLAYGSRENIGLACAG